MNLRLVVVLCSVAVSSSAFAQDHRPGRWHRQRYQPPPPPPPRDCGTGYDPGCETWRNGRLPMEASAFNGLLAALDATPFEYTRLDILRAAMGSTSVTSAQLGRIFDRFDHEYLRLDAATACAPVLVDPGNAWGLVARFDHCFIGQDFAKLIAAQQ